MLALVYPNLNLRNVSVLFGCVQGSQADVGSRAGAVLEEGANLNDVSLLLLLAFLSSTLAPSLQGPIHAKVQHTRIRGPRMRKEPPKRNWAH